MTRITFLRTWPAILALAAAAPTPAVAQVVGIGATWGSSEGAFLPGGPGVGAFAALEPYGPLRVQLSLAHERGSETERSIICDQYEPKQVGCVEQDVEQVNNVTTGDLTVVALTPERSGFRVGAGVSVGPRWIDAERRGTTTDRTEQPFRDRTDPIWGWGWLVTAEHRGLLAEPISLRAAVQGWNVDFGDCFTGAFFELCDSQSFMRFHVGLAYRL